MSGWLIARSLTGGPLDEERWRRSIDRIPANELSVDQAFSGKCAIAAWRREQGEFALSGRLTSPNPDGGKRVAWIGQCVNDAGDATPAAIECVSRLGIESAQTAADLNGAFAAAVIDDRDDTISVTIGRFAHYPVYTFRSGQVWAASTDIGCLIPWMDRPCMDMTSVNLILRAGELLDRRTLLEGVEALPGGTFLSIDGSGIRETRYWRYRTESDRSLPRRHAVAQLADNFEVAELLSVNFSPAEGAPHRRQVRVGVEHIDVERAL